MRAASDNYLLDSILLHVNAQDELWLSHASVKFDPVC